MWRLQFIESDGSYEYTPHEKGAWIVRLSLMEHSPPTYIDSHLLIPDARAPPSASATPSPSLSLPACPISSPDGMGSIPGRLFTSQIRDPNKLKPTIELRIKTNSSNQLAPTRKSHERYDGSFVHQLSVPLNKSLMGNSLQFECVCCLCSCSARVVLTRIAVVARISPRTAHCLPS